MPVSTWPNLSGRLAEEKVVLRAVNYNIKIYS